MTGHVESVLGELLLQVRVKGTLVSIEQNKEGLIRDLRVSIGKNDEGVMSDLHVSIEPNKEGDNQGPTRLYWTERRGVMRGPQISLGQDKEGSVSVYRTEQRGNLEG